MELNRMEQNGMDREKCFFLATVFQHVDTIDQIQMQQLAANLLQTA